MDPRLPRVAALAVAGATIAGGVDVREGDTDTVGHERIDLDGRCVAARLHRQRTCTSRSGRWPAAQLDLRGCGSKAEALRQVAAQGGDRLAARQRLGAGALARRARDRGRPGRGHRRSPGGALVARRPHLWVNSAALASDRRDAPHRRPARGEPRSTFPLPAPEPLELLAGRARGHGRGQRPRRRRRARLPAPRRPRPVAAARRRPPPAPARAHVVPVEHARRGDGAGAALRLRQRAVRASGR